MKYLAFCDRQSYVSVPASAQTVYEYLAFLSLEGSVKPQLWMQYASVFNSMHKDLALPTPWMESGFCSSFVQSALKLVTSAAYEHAPWQEAPPGCASVAFLV